MVTLDCNKMKYTLFLIGMLFVSLSGCKDDYPMDEDGSLITTRSECYVSSFELLGADFQTVRTKAALVDTVEQTIKVEVLFGTDLKNLYPQFSLVTDAVLDPKILGKQDFSNLDTPREWTVVSGNRKVRKTYKVYLTVQK